MWLLLCFPFSSCPIPPYYWLNSPFKSGAFNVSTPERGRQSAVLEYSLLECCHGWPIAAAVLPQHSRGGAAPQSEWLTKMRVLTIWDFTKKQNKQKLLYSHSCCLECSSTYFTSEHPRILLSSSLNKHFHILKQPFLDLGTCSQHFFLSLYTIFFILFYN